MKKNFSLLLAIASLANYSLFGAVINVSPKGDDENGNGSVAKPYATLARAVEEAKKMEINQVR